MSLIQTYSPADVLLVFNGFDLNSGLDPDSWIRVTRNTPKYSYIPSVDSGGARMLTSDNSAKIELKLMQTSSVNRILFALEKNDDGTDPLSISQFTFSDEVNGGMAYQKANNCWISKSPDTTYSDSMENLTWEFTCEELIPTASL